MVTKRQDSRPHGGVAPVDWDDESVTDVGALVSEALRAGSPLPPSSQRREAIPRVDDEEDNPQEMTGRYPPAKHGGEGSAGAALPKFLTAFLDVLSGPDASGPHELTMVRTVLGRGRQADIRLQDKRLSRQHASITYTANEFRIRNEQSANGTFLNGSRVVEYALRDGDKLLVGDTLLRFRVVSHGT